MCSCIYLRCVMCLADREAREAPPEEITTRKWRPPRWSLERVNEATSSQERGSSQGSNRRKSSGERRFSWERITGGSTATSKPPMQTVMEVMPPPVLTRSPPVRTPSLPAIPDCLDSTNG